jgi:hypothetical protein
VHVQKLVSVVKMAKVLEECITKDYSSVARFLWTKGLNGKGIYKEMFPVYCEKGFSRKAIHSWVEIRAIESRRRCPTICGSGRDNSQKTSTLRVSTHR